MQKITTFLTFNNQAEEAVNLYTSTFKNAKILNSRRYGDAGPGLKGSMMTAEFELEGQRFIALNGGPSFTFSQGISLFVNCETQAEIDELSAKLTAAGGRQEPCGWVTDKFGVSWQIVPTILGKLLGDRDPAKAKRVMQAMLQMKKLDIATLEQAAEGAVSVSR